MPHSHTSEDIHQVVVDFADQSRAYVLATVLETGGSTPRKAGAKAILDAAGVVSGTIGGGPVEAEAQHRVAEVIKTGQPFVFDFDLLSGAVDGHDPICGGAMRVLLDPTTARHREAFAAASAIRQDRERGALLTTVHGGEACTVDVECLAEEAIPSDIGFPGAEIIRSVLEKEEPRHFVAKSGRKELLVEPLIPKPVLLIVGGGHVGQAVATLADLVGFDIVVIDDRPEFTRPELFPDGATMRCGEIAEEVAGFPFAADTYVVIVTRGHNHDADALAACLRQPAAYLGMIGSHRKIAMIRESFVDSDRATAAQFDRVYAPIGLDIGSVTVPEIAASIVAQLIAVRRQGTSPRIPAR